MVTFIAATPSLPRNFPFLRYNQIWAANFKVAQRGPEQMTALKIESTAALPLEIAVVGSAGSPLARRAHSELPHAYRTPFARDAARRRGGEDRQIQPHG